jgi:DNA-binding beta-propeller fold protein YncE
VGNACGPDQGCLAGACADCATSIGACTAEVVAACANLDQVRLLRSDLSLADAPLATDQLPISFASVGGKLFVANSTSSTISTIVVSPPSATSGSAAIAVSSASAGYGDLEYLATYGSFLLASNAATNTLAVVDPVGGKVVDEVPLPQGPYGANPQGMAFAGSKGYLALNSLDAVALLDSSSMPGLTLRPTTIDLLPLAIAPARPMPSRVVAVGTRIYVTLNDLDPTTYAPLASGHGRLVVIDSATDSLVGAPVDLGAGCLDPSGMAVYGTTLWVACGFHAYDSAQVTGGALVPVELATGTPVVGTPIALAQSAVGSVAFCDGQGYAGATESGTVIAFDPVARTVSATALACPPSPGKASYVSDVACAR